ncbi:MAG: hypothetical protein Q8K18_04475 [Burkholderiales bacterium]|nr:hypothetical protein [Burkholderiales bacterium]
MTDKDKPATDVKQPARQSPAYSTFPETTTHGPRDKRCYHGKPEDWKRNNLKRTFGGKIK